MTQDEILKKLSDIISRNQNYTTWTVSTPHMEMLVNEAIAEEREACAKVADDRIGPHNSVSRAIRARGEQA